MVPKPTDRSLIGTRWVSRTKKNNQVVVTRNKSRLAMQGYNQKEIIYYDETFALVARTKAIRMLVVFTSHIEFKLFQRNIKSVFLNGYLMEEVCVKKSSGFESFGCPDYVYKLDKALYRLKQSSKVWCDRLSFFF